MVLIANRSASRGRLRQRNRLKATRPAQHISCTQHELYMTNREKITASVKHYYREQVYNRIWMLPRMSTKVLCAEGISQSQSVSRSRFRSPIGARLLSPTKRDPVHVHRRVLLCKSSRAIDDAVSPVLD